jgi:hypothetical protein
MDNIQKAKSKAILNYNYDELMNEAKEYAGSEWDNLTKSEKEDLIEEMKSDRAEHIRRMDEGGEADSEREDEEREEERDEANERLEELMEEYDLPREVIEEYQSVMGIEIEDITDLPFSGRYDSEEDFAEDMVEQGAISNLSYYLEMTSLDMRLLAQEEADNRVDDMDDDELLKTMDMEDEANEYNELEDEIDDLESDVDDLKSKLDDYLDEEDLTEGEMEMREEKAKELRDEIDEKENELENLQDKLASLDTYDEVVDKAREQLRDVYYDDIHDELERDVVGYFVDNLGYAEEDLADNIFFRVDYEKLASDLSHDYTIIEHGGDVYVFGTYADGGMTYAKGGEVINLTTSEKNKLRNIFRTLDRLERTQNELDEHDEEQKEIDDDMNHYFDLYYKFKSELIKKYGKSKDLEKAINKVVFDYGYSYADGGMIYAKGGNLPSIEKRVAEVNAMIKEGNEKGLKVVDESQTWQSPMKYNPLKYSNGVLYVSYQELDLYKYRKSGGRDSLWEKQNYRIGKNEMGMGLSEGSAQKETLTEIARMYRKALNHFNKYGWYGDGGMTYAKGGETDEKVVELTPIYTTRDKKGFRFYSAENGNKLYAEKNGEVYEVNEDTLKPTFIVNNIFLTRYKFVGLIDDSDVKDLHPLHYEREGIKRVRKSFGLKDGGSIYAKGGATDKYILNIPDLMPFEYGDRPRILMVAKKYGVKIRDYQYPNDNGNIEFNAIGRFEDLKDFNIELLRIEKSDIYYYLKSMGFDSWEELIEKYADGGYMAKGGATFDDKVKSIKERLEGMSVAPKYKKKYGKTYDKSEALSAAKAIAGSMRAKEMSKKKS